LRRRASAAWLTLLALAVAVACGAVAVGEAPSNTVDAGGVERILITAPPGGRTYEPETRAAVVELAGRLKALPQVAQVHMPLVSADRTRAVVRVRLAAGEDDDEPVERAVDAVREQHGGTGLELEHRPSAP
jgi:hypothetical protein